MSGSPPSSWNDRLGMDDVCPNCGSVEIRLTFRSGEGFRRTELLDGNCPDCAYQWTETRVAARPRRLALYPSED